MMNKKHKKIYKNVEKKIYFKNININNLKPNTINNLKKKYKYNIKCHNFLLSNNEKK